MEKEMETTIGFGGQEWKRTWDYYNGLYTDYYNGLYRDYYKDPFLHS